MIARNNKAIIITGSPATGKSTYAQKLAKEISAVLLDLDTCTERLIQTALKANNRDPNDRDSQYYKETYRKAVYETLFDIAKENLVHQTVIIVGPFTKELRDPNWNMTLSQRLESEVEIHHIVCRSEVRKARMLKRANPRDLQKFKDWQKSSDYYLNEELPACECIVVDNSETVPEF